MNEPEKALAKRTLKNLRSTWSELRYDEVHNKPYLIGKKRPDQEMKVISPMNTNKCLSFNSLKDIINNSGQSSVILSIQSTDSTDVYYKCEIGLKSPHNQITDPQIEEHSDESSES